MRYISKGTDENNCRKSFSNAVSAFRSGRKFPHYVFTQRWEHFLFLDEGWLFCKEFVDIASELLTIEKSNVICLLNLARSMSYEFEEAAAVYLDKNSKGKDYVDFLRGNKPGDPEAWIFNMEEYICISDVGEWCIYCEMGDMAVIAFQENGLEKFKSAIGLLHAYPLDQVCLPGQDGLFPYNEMSQEWHDGLFRNYVHAQKNHREMKG
ncbi:MAG: hypothetical protein RBR37_01235 [Advenella sp.]|nr:hypothetical protein [Advenella sp.]